LIVRLLEYIYIDSARKPLNLVLEMLLSLHTLSIIFFRCGLMSESLNKTPSRDRGSSIKYRFWVGSPFKYQTVVINADYGGVMNKLGYGYMLYLGAGLT